MGHSPWGRKESDTTEQLMQARWGIRVTDDGFITFLYVLNFLEQTYTFFYNRKL